MSIKLSAYMADALMDMWSALFGGSLIKVYDEAGTELVSFQLPHVPFRESDQGETNLREQIFARAVENGFASKYAVVKADGTLLFEGPVGTGDGALHINSTQLIKGGEVILNSFKQYLEIG